jgi:hypothetical protein
MKLSPANNVASVGLGHLPGSGIRPNQAPIVVSGARLR